MQVVYLLERRGDPDDEERLGVFNDALEAMESASDDLAELAADERDRGIEYLEQLPATLAWSFFPRAQNEPLFLTRADENPLNVFYAITRFEVR